MPAPLAAAAAPDLDELDAQRRRVHEGVAVEGAPAADPRLHAVLAEGAHPTDEEKLEYARRALENMLQTPRYYDALPQAVKDEVGMTYDEFKSHATANKQAVLNAFQNEFFEEAKKQYAAWLANQEAQMASGAPHAGRMRPAADGGEPRPLDKNRLVAIDPKTQRLAFLEVKNHTYRDITDREVITTNKAGNKKDQVRDILHQFAWIRQERPEEFFDEEGLTPSIRIGFDSIHLFDGRAKYHESMRRGLTYALQVGLPVDLSFDPEDHKFDPSDEVERFTKDAAESMQANLVTALVAKTRTPADIQTSQKACQDAMLIAFTKRFEKVMYAFSQTNPFRTPSHADLQRLHEQTYDQLKRDIQEEKEEFGRDGQFSVLRAAEKAREKDASIVGESGWSEDMLVRNAQRTLLDAAEHFTTTRTFGPNSTLQNPNIVNQGISVRPDAMVPGDDDHGYDHGAGAAPQGM